MTAPRRKRASPERQIQAAIVKFLRIALPKDAWVGAIPGGDGKMTRAPGYVAGTPDLLIVWRGRAHFIEVKAPTGAVSKEQTTQRLILSTAGASWAAARSIDDAERICRFWEIPLSATAIGAAVFREAA